MILELEVPRKLAPLLEHARYKGIHGGRGSGKSHFFAQLATATNYSKPARGVCIREVQNSIKDSVKQLIEDKIEQQGLGAFYDITRDEIRGRNGSLMVFKGMQAYNAENIKSLEGFDWAWVEEAQTLSARSWRMLRPTIRKPGSEIWCSWNPRHDSDPVDEFLRGAHKPAGAIVLESNWNDNPWLPEVLRTEKDRDYTVDPEQADHVWGGQYEIITEASYYARQIAFLEKTGRVGYFPYDPRHRLRTAWDLGIDDYTAIWFIQDNGVEATVVDYYECNGEGFDGIVATALPEIFIPPSEDQAWVGWDRQKAIDAAGRTQPFRYDAHFLPHDVKVRELGAGARARHQSLYQLGLKEIRKGIPTSTEEKVGAVRRLLPSVKFNATSRVMHGLKRLRHYKRRLNELMGVYVGPLKDGNDHGADAFGEYALNCELLPRIEPPKIDPMAELLKPRTIAQALGSFEDDDD